MGSGRRTHRVVVAAAFVALIVGIVVPWGFASVGASAPETPAHLSPAVRPFALCMGPFVVPNVTGEVHVAAATPPYPSVVNLTVQLSYFYEINFTPKIGHPSVSCTSGGVLAKTDRHGVFLANESLPTPSCTPSGCVNYAGPFGPENLTIPGFSVPGYFLTGGVIGANGSIDVVQALGTTQLTPTGRTTVSVNAPTVVQAEALAGDGTPSPATVGYAWVLSGTGWSFVGAARGASVTVVASPQSNPGTLTVWTNGTYGTLNVSSPPTVLQLVAVATSVVAGSLVPTALDAGTPAAFTVDGVGSGGYGYTAILVPGLGNPDVALACSTRSIAGGEVDIHCNGAATYALAGTAQPTANLSNGFSTAQWTYPQVTISPSLVVVVTPQPAVAYRGANVAYTVSVGTASGTAPFGPACLWTGDGRSTCTSTVGTSWSAGFVFGSPGLYEGHATVMDAAGTNRSVPVVTEIVDRPQLANLTAATNELIVGGSDNLSSVLAGGAFPVSYWWNVSRPASTIASGVRTGPGELALTFTTTTPGLTVVTLTVVDELGTRVAVPVAIQVSAGPAVSVDAVGGLSGDTLSAGAPFSVSFVAADPYLERVPTFAGALAIALTGPGGAELAATVNSTSLGPLARGPNGSFEVPAAAWQDGFLNLTLDVYQSGAAVLRMSAPSIPLAAGPTSWRLWVTDDVTHLHLHDAHVVRTGGWFNDTIWRIDDRFGNPAVGSYVIVQSRFGGVVTSVDSPVEYGPNGTRVWVNYSAAGTDGGIVNVLDQFGVALLAPLTVPAPPSGGVPASVVVALGAAVLLGGITLVAVVRWRTATSRTKAASDGEAELRRFAEGRSHVLDRVPAQGDVDLDTIADGFAGRPPTPAELTEWVASLVAEGTLVAALGPDGRPRFRRAPPKLAEARPRVEMDPDALASALARREHDGTDDAGDPESGP